MERRPVRPRRTVMLALAAALCAGPPVAAEGLPDYPEASSPFGMNGAFDYSEEQAALQRLDPPAVMDVVEARDVKYAMELGARHYRAQPAEYAGFAMDRMAAGGTEGEIDFARTDALVQTAQRVGMNVLPVLALRAHPDAAAEAGGQYAPASLDAYAAWVRAVVERYDGDGERDMPGLRFRIAAWQVEATPDLIAQTNDGRYFPAEAYARLLGAAAEAIRGADAEAQVVIGAISSADARDGGLAFLDAVLAEAADDVDVMAFEYLPGTLTSSELREALKAMQARAGGRPLWCTLSGSYSRYTPRNAMRDRAATEETQAADLVRRYSYMLARGVKRIYEAGMTEEGPDKWKNRTFYSGLRHHDGSAKLAYSSYRLVVRLLGPVQPELSATLSDGQNDLVILQFRRQPEALPVYVLWWDYAVTQSYKAGQLDPEAFAEVPLRVAYDVVEVGEMVQTAVGPFKTLVWNLEDGEITLPLRRVPLMLRAQAPAEAPAAEPPKT